MKWILLSFLFCASSFAAGSQLNVQIGNMRNGNGHVLVALHNTPEGFPQDNSKAVRSAKVQSARSGVVVHFDNLAPGNYAVAFLHDENDNGKMDNNGFGMPMEGFGFSRDPHITFSAPSFEETQVPVQGPVTNIRANMQYL